VSRRPTAANPVRRRGDVRRRLWSESSIPKVATRRVRMAGEPGAGPLYSNQLFGGFVDQATFGTYCADGDAVIVLLVAIGTPPALPSGWTSLGSGTVTILGYRVGWTTHAAGRSYDFTDGDVGRCTLLRFTGATGWTPTAATVGTASSATSVPFVSTSGLTSSFQSAFATPVAATTIGSYANLGTTPGGQDAARQIVAGSPRDLGVVFSDNSSFDTETILTGSATCTETCEWVSIAVGFV
jgi:hypothetical protein